MLEGKLEFEQLQNPFLHVGGKEVEYENMRWHEEQTEFKANDFNL